MPFKSLPIWKITILICTPVSTNKVKPLFYWLVHLFLTGLLPFPWNSQEISPLLCIVEHWNLLFPFSSASNIFHSLGNFSILPNRGLGFLCMFRSCPISNIKEIHVLFYSFYNFTFTVFSNCKLKCRYNCVIIYTVEAQLGKETAKYFKEIKHWQWLLLNGRVIYDFFFCNF